MRPPPISPENPSSFHDYTVYGLHLRSCIELPELTPVPVLEVEPDLWIRCGPVPDRLEAACTKTPFWQAASDRVLIMLEGIARYLISDGREIVIETEPAATDQEVRLVSARFVAGGGVAAAWQADVACQRGDCRRVGSRLPGTVGPWQVESGGGAGTTRVSGPCRRYLRSRDATGRPAGAGGTAPLSALGGCPSAALALNGGRGIGCIPRNPSTWCQWPLPAHMRPPRWVAATSSTPKPRVVSKPALRPCGVGRSSTRYWPTPTEGRF